MTDLPVAALPMYDLPEVRDATDALWAALHDAFRDAGTAAPGCLHRRGTLPEVWLNPRLMLAQACGLPYVQHLRGRVALIGAPDYGIEDAPPGHYRSVLVVRADDPREDLAAFRGAVAAINEPGSQSGHAALLYHVGTLARSGRFFGALHETGGHAASVVAVAEGSTDIAAIDAVTWRLLQRHRREARTLRVLARTETVPGLPLIAAAGTDVARHRAVVSAAFCALAPWIAEALGIRGFVPFDPADYDVIHERWQATGAERAVVIAAGA